MYPNFPPVNVPFFATRRSGTSVYYRLACPRIAEACDLVRAVLREQLADAAALAKH